MSRGQPPKRSTLSPQRRLKVNLKQVDSWLNSGKLSKARDLLRGCRVIYLAALSEEERPQWESLVEEREARLGGLVGPKGLLDDWPTAAALTANGAASPQRNEQASALLATSPAWERLGKALDDRHIDFVVLDLDAGPRFRFDFVSSGHNVELWVTVRDPTSRAWTTKSPGQLAPARALRPGAAGFERRLPNEVERHEFLLVWRFGSLLDGRVAVKDAVLASGGEAELSVEVRRHPQPARADIDLQIERLGSRSFRPGHGSKRFAVTTCARCGQPLADPSSVTLGIGPDCVKYFDPAVVAAAKRWVPGSVRALGRKQGDYFRDVSSDNW